ncbi:MAG TPA: hypothetical protein VH722_09400 [Alphaproteobacteria bacterium]|jgi:hypothetical protein|nr:hypothetical protein [Alphaproteobacteria bacterium]
MATARDIIDACEAEWDAHQSDCSGFARAVAARLGVTLTGMANDIVGEIAMAPWSPVADGPGAAAQAAQGRLVIAGLNGADQQAPDAHGHVVVVVQGALAHGLYPTAYWGQLGGVGKKDMTLNWAWREGDRDNITYGAIDTA